MTRSRERFRGGNCPALVGASLHERKEEFASLIHLRASGVRDFSRSLAPAMAILLSRRARAFEVARGVCVCDFFVVR